MEDKNLVNTTPVVEEVATDGSKKKKTLLLIIAIGIIIIAIVVGVVLVGMKNKDAELSSLDDAITSIESLFSDTEDIDNEMGDLPEDFLEAESVSTEEIDNSISDLDEQMDELDTLDEDYELESSDVGLE